MWYSGYLLSIVYQSGGKFQMRMYHQWIHQRPTWSHKMQVNTISNKPRDWAKNSLCSLRLFFGFFLFSCAVFLRIKAVKAGINFYMTNKRTYNHCWHPQDCFGLVVLPAFFRHVTSSLRSLDADVSQAFYKHYLAPKPDIHKIDLAIVLVFWGHLPIFWEVFCSVFVLKLKGAYLSGGVLRVFWGHPLKIDGFITICLLGNSRACI